MHHKTSLTNNDQVVCHGETRVAQSKEGEDPYAEPKARGIFVKVAMTIGIKCMGFLLLVEVQKSQYGLLVDKFRNS